MISDHECDVKGSVSNQKFYEKEKKKKLLIAVNGEFQPSSNSVTIE